MGDYFSWVDVKGKSNITDEDKSSVLLLPKEHIEEVGAFFGLDLSEEDHGISGWYDCQGYIKADNGLDPFRFSPKYNVLEAVAFVNICCTTDEQYEDVHFHNRYVDNAKEIADEIRKAYKENLISDIDEIEDIISEYSDKSFRDFGFELVGKDRCNARLPYPLKMTTSSVQKYEDCEFSMIDPNNGMRKFNISEDEPEYIMEEGWDENNKFGEMKTYNDAYDYVITERLRQEILEEIKNEREIEKDDKDEATIDEM